MGSKNQVRFMIEFIECDECDMRFENHASNWIHLHKGNYCYECGAKLTEEVRTMELNEYLEYEKEKW